MAVADTPPAAGTADLRGMVASAGIWAAVGMPLAGCTPVQGLRAIRSLVVPRSEEAFLVGHVLGEAAAGLVWACGSAATAMETIAGDTVVGGVTVIRILAAELTPIGGGTRIPRIQTPDPNTTMAWRTR